MTQKPSSIVFSADGRSQAGGGHVRRCLALARALQPDYKVAFLAGVSWARHWRAAIAGAGLPILESADGLGRISIAVLDGYDLKPSEVAWWRQRAARLVLVEDLGRSFAGVDLYVSPSAPAPAGAAALEGPNFALLAAEYAEAVIARPTSGGRNVLITCGLRDSENLSELFIDALTQGCPASSNGKITVVLGSEAPHREAIQRKADRIGAQVVIDAGNMRALYDDADIVLGTGGVSLFERMARGRASVTAIAAPKQRYSAEPMTARGATVLLPESPKLDDVMARIGALMEDEGARAAMGTAARRIVDGRGAARVAERIRALATADAASESILITHDVV